jgi:hypothetical protein
MVAPDRSAVCLSVDAVQGSDTECGPRRTGPSIVMSTPGDEPAVIGVVTAARLENASAVVAALEASAGSAQVRLGSGLVGCIREGPGVRLSGRGKVGGFAGVEWGSCLLPPSCSGGLVRGRKS